MYETSPWSAVSVAVLVAGQLGCADDSADRADTAANSARDGRAEVAAFDAGTTTDTTSAGAGVVWSASPPPARGDGQLVDVAETNPGFGWDNCFSNRRFNRTEKGAMPPPTQGDGYLLSVVAKTPGPPSDDAPSAYFFTKSPVSAQGLWFDVALVEGSAAGATLTLSTTDDVCTFQQRLATVELATPLAQPRVWKSGCVDVSRAGPLRAIGVRIDADQGVIGLDSLRFDGPCR